MDKTIRLSALLCLLILAGGCTSPTPYKKYGDILHPIDVEGYKDEVIGDREYEITYEGNPHTSNELVASYWHRRARELCGSGNYQANMEVVQRSEQLNRRLHTFYPLARGTVKCL